MASKYRKKFELPEGFYEILESYSREVLRDQPLDIIEFSYMYFKALEEVSHQSISHRNNSKPPHHKSQASLMEKNIAAVSLI